MIGAMLIIFLVIPETPWWLVGKGRLEKAAKVLTRYNGHIKGYNAQDQINVMAATIAEEKRTAENNSEAGPMAVFQGRNKIRFLIASWPKVY